MRTGEIKALTGLRIVAALWVVLFHFRPLLWNASPRLQDDLAPLLNAGAQGVDLFFILSGFVLTWNYLERMGPSWSRRATMHFLWLRLSRVWPVYLVTMHLAALWILFTLHVGTTPSLDVTKLTAISYVRQFFMVQLWFEPFFDGTSWDGPAWSISAEWLAYLVFGAAVLVIYRMSLVTRARSLFLLAFLATTPTTILLLASGHFYTPWSWLPRILAQFVAGALACAAVRRLRLGDRAQQAAGYGSIAIVAAMVGILYYYDANPVPGMVDPGGLVDLLFLPLVVALSIGMGSLPRLLSTRLLVYGGQISFSLYMVHEIIHTAWNWAVVEYTIDIPKSTAKLVVVGLIVAAFGAAALLYHFVEEPARLWMRRMVDYKDVKKGNVKPITPARGHRTPARAVIAIVWIASMAAFTNQPQTHQYELASRGYALKHVAVIGDSYTNGTAIGGQGPNSWPNLAWQQLSRQGLQVDADVEAEGRAGYGVRGDQGNLFSDLTARAVKSDDALVLFFGSRNDQPVDLGLYSSLVAQNFQIARDIAPSAKIVVIGPPWPTADPPGEVWALRDRLLDQARAVGAIWVDPLAEGWFVGRPDLIGRDGVHPTNAGHMYMARKIAPLIHNLLTAQV